MDLQENEEIKGIEDVRYKVSLVAEGYSQRERVDFNEVFFPIVKHSFIYVLLAMFALHDLEPHQLDVKMIFLHSELEETMYICAN